MTDVRILAIAALLLQLCMACAKSEPPAGGTNTNWLKHCDESADCKGAGDCLCGVCTLGCTSNAECSPVGRDVRCTPSQEQSCGASAPDSLCLLPADPDPDPDPDADAQVDAQANGGDASVPGSGDAGLTLTRVGNEVQVTERYRPCGLDDDCILVGTSCDGCCEQDAIRAHDRDAYAINHELACAALQPRCSCAFADIVPRCVDGLCAAVTPDPIRDCYSPTQNTPRAYFPAALGCACATVGLQVCVDLVSLICVGVPDGARWMRIDDGACSGNAECPLERQRTDAEGCLAEFTTCTERQAGGFCGRGCRFPLACSGQECQYSPFTEECTGVGVWEGLCGSVRYRTQGGGLGGPTWYWDEATGKLLATQYTSDYSDPKCEGVTVGGDFTVVESCDVVLDTTTAICSWP